MEYYSAITVMFFINAYTIVERGDRAADKNTKNNLDNVCMFLMENILDLVSFVFFLLKMSWQLNMLPGFEKYFMRSITPRTNQTSY